MSYSPTILGAVFQNMGEEEEEGGNNRDLEWAEPQFRVVYPNIHVRTAFVALVSLDYPQHSL